MKASKKLRKIHKALLDHYGPQNWWPGDSEFEICIGAILTQNTSWHNVEKAIGNLKAGNLLKPEALYKLPVYELAQLIIPSGYYNIKADRLRNFLEFLVAQNGGSFKRVFSGGIDEVRKRLLSVRGIGPETADSMILYAGGLPVFVIDAYTMRIFTRLGLCRQNVSYPDLQRLFMNNLKPADTSLFNEYHALLVRLGKQVCKKKPVCSECPIAEMCEAYKRF